MPGRKPSCARSRINETKMNAHPPKMLSVVVPAHNEALGIAHAVDVMLQALASCGMNLEIIVIDDGSRDETFE